MVKRYHSNYLFTYLRNILSLLFLADLTWSGKLRVMESNPAWALHPALQKLPNFDLA